MMKKILLGLAATLVLAIAGLYLVTQPMLRSDNTVAFSALPPGDATRGAHIAAIAGCTSCHSPDLGGRDFVAEDFIFKLVAPDLTRARDKYDDAALVRLLRTGAKSDGYYALGMPSEMQQRMTDGEVADVIAFLRSVPPSKTPVQGKSRLYPLGRIGLLAGEYHAYEGDTPESATVLRDRNEPRRGRHIALIACTECHGSKLEGGGDMGAPALVIAKAYSREQFTRLMRTGITLAGTESKSGMMTGVARRRFKALTDDEIADLQDYLVASD